MDIPKKLKDKFQKFDLGTFEAMKEKEFRPGFNLTDLKYLRDKAGNERNLRELYRGRPAYELLQNADDAHAHVVAFILCHDGLVFAHDGDWFTVENFRSLADGWSDKDPNQCIGHKGLGFRSVLDITPSPYLAEVDPRGFFAVKFTWALNYNHIQQAFKKDPSLREHYQSWTKYGQRACPVMAIPGTAKKHNLGGASNILDRLARGEYGQGFTTMFWFPAQDPDIDPKVFRELGPTPITSSPKGRERLLRFVEGEVSTLLPFLSSVRSVTVYDGTSPIAQAALEGVGQRKNAGEIVAKVGIGSEVASESFFQARYEFDIPYEVKKDAETPKAVQEMAKAEIVLSVRVENGRPVHDSEGRFHVYFPTDEKTGLGCLVHGDFFVKPDRTRLMDGAYNEWLLGNAAKKAAGDFLTQLLKRYRPVDAFAALSPTGSTATWASQELVSDFSKELVARQEPFVPGRGKLLTAHEVAVPPEVDSDGFWDSHFTEELEEVMPGCKSFLAPEHDNRTTRAFLRLAGIQPIDYDLAIDFMEAGGAKGQDARWWYDCLAFISQHPKLSQMTRDDFAGRHLISTEDSGVIEVSTGAGRVVCLPPAAESDLLHVPECFSSVFAFLEPSLAQMLKDERVTAISTWVLDRFRIARFEAAELLPRAVGAVAPKLYSGELSLSATALGKAWTFLYRMTKSSRRIESQDFWRGISRFPLPVAATGADDDIGRDALAPAFLTYWPEPFADEESCLRGVASIRRVDAHFLEGLVADSAIPLEEWRDFLGEIGVSENPRLLTYRRLAVGGEDIDLSPDGPNALARSKFSGERQRDENIAAAQVLSRGPLWNSVLSTVRLCGHDAAKVLGTASLLEGLDECVEKANAEYAKNDDQWRERLTQLARELPAEAIAQAQTDGIYCRGGSSGGHTLPAGSCVRRQLANVAWLPSSYGPASGSSCFLRQATRRFISSGRSDEELGDLILPYVVVDDLESAARLERFGVKVLEDAPSAEPEVLLKALTVLGERLSSDWGRNEILNVRARWRLVRGAIQEAYRRLNQVDEAYEFPAAMKWAVRSKEGPIFRRTPLYYAEPGSAVEQAFLEVLPLLDVDRAYPKLFDAAGIIRLEPGDTVKEQFLGESASQQLDSLKQEIVTSLCPYLIAVLSAKGDQPKHCELVVRRLKERFEVRATAALEVSFTFEADKKYERTVRFPYFYLQSKLVQREGAIQERHYKLYIAGESPKSLFLLDADALGDSICPVLLDDTSNELAGLFPRVVSRYKYTRGNRKEMEDFMYHHLGISPEAMDMARALISGEVDSIVPPPPPPPPAQPSTSKNAPTWTESDAADTKKKFDETFRDAANSFSDVLVTAPGGSSGSGGGGGGKHPHGHGGNLQFDEPTPEQQRRGESGEEEIKRRLEMPGGWAGMTLIADKREKRCGYDFLCKDGDREVKLEVKTFSRNGRVIVTTDELREAATSGTDYVLLGVLDDGGPATEWKTMLVPNPFPALVKSGKLSIKTKLEVPASEVFDL